ncbi:hypothetical protein [Paracoccus sp. pheM1]|uniref:hypothetical protein n=1 Tax=Paracoccus sp. pheM1 TaxID=2831675 RepID=UPI001BDB81A1|nr:hypothetical protein [Paracoccus sp. pheM1]MBT0781751.1 hypothetical protein [Paracoccus sp. pheM1]
MRLLICLALLCFPVSAAAQIYLADFQDALSRCQASLETTTGFSDDGLERVGEAETELPLNVRDRRIWRFLSSPLQVVHSTYIDGVGQLRSTCDVSLLKGATPLTPEERDALFHSFVSRMEQQIAEGTHERRDPEKIPPIVTLGYGPLKRGIHGCRVIISLAFMTDGDFFRVNAGEQITHPCDK